MHNWTRRRMPWGPIFDVVAYQTLRKHCGAADAAVLAESKDESNKRLVAYVVRGPRRRGRSMGRAGQAETCVLYWNDICRSTWCPATSWNWRRSR